MKFDHTGKVKTPMMIGESDGAQFYYPWKAFFAGFISGVILCGLIGFVVFILWNS